MDDWPAVRAAHLCCLWRGLLLLVTCFCHTIVAEASSAGDARAGVGLTLRSHAPSTGAESPAEAQEELKILVQALRGLATEDNLPRAVVVVN